MKLSDEHSQAILQNIFLLENIQGGIVYSDYDPPFCLRFVTEGMALLSGYTREELLNMQQMDLVHDDDIATLVEDVTRQFAVGDTFEVEYRLKRKDGSYVHVLDRAKAVEHADGKKYIHCLLTDITQHKQLEQALRLSEEKYKIAMQQTGYAILEYDPATSTLCFSDNYAQIFGNAEACATLQDFAHSSSIPPQYAQPLLDLFALAVNDRASTRMELQVRSSSARPLWCSLLLTPLLDTSGRVYAVLGCLQNIDARKRRLQELTELSQRDGLTGTYNRHTVENIVNRHLSNTEGKGRGAFIIFDIDNFKHINDTFGHDVGDELLIAMVERVRGFLHPQDVLGRLGGDEFLIFVPDVDDPSSMAILAAHIVQGVRHSFADARYPVTVSLGVALGGDEDTTFKALYKKADQALYEVKRRGRNGYHMYRKSAADTAQP